MRIGEKVTQAKLVGTDLLLCFTGEIIDTPVSVDVDRGLSYEDYGQSRRRFGDIVEELVTWFASAEMLWRYHRRPCPLLQI
jgi:hypothetical protein